MFVQRTDLIEFAARFCSVKAGDIKFNQIPELAWCFYIGPPCISTVTVGELVLGLSGSVVRQGNITFDAIQLYRVLMWIT